MVTPDPDPLYVDEPPSRRPLPEPDRSPVVIAWLLVALVVAAAVVVVVWRLG